MPGLRFGNQADPEVVHFHWVGESENLDRKIGKGIDEKGWCDEKGSFRSRPAPVP